MKYQGKITDPKDLVTKEYVDTGLSGKQNTLTFDDVPTAGSSNPVKSSGIKSALNSVEEDIAIRIVGNKTTHSGGAAIYQYVIVSDSTITGIADGLYKAAKAIPYNTAIDSTYLAAVNGGVANAVKADFAPEELLYLLNPNNIFYDLNNSIQNYNYLVCVVNCNGRTRASSMILPVNAIGVDGNSTYQYIASVTEYDNSAMYHAYVQFAFVSNAKIYIIGSGSSGWSGDISFNIYGGL